MERLSKKDIEFLNKVEREGTNKIRYDKLISSNTWEPKYDDTSSIFVYDYENKKIVIFKERGEFINYFIEQT